jgi:hypothetical protein
MEADMLPMMKMKKMPLSLGEATALRIGLERFDRAMVNPIIHMSERQIPLRAKTLWLFYLPDFTNIFREWYGRYIAGIISIYHPRAKAWIAFEKGFLLLKYSGERPRKVIRRMCECGDWRLVDRILEDAFDAECECGEVIEYFEKNLRRKRKPKLGVLIDAMTRFAAYGLDTVFPEDLLSERFPWVEISRLYGSPISSWSILLEESIASIERIYLGTPEKLEIKNYAKRFSHLSWGTIRSQDYDLAFAETMLRGAKHNLPNLKAIWDRTQLRAEQARIHGSSAGNYIRYVNRCAGQIADGDRALWEHLVRFASEAQRYNEMRRIYFTKTLKLVRDFAEMNSIDWRTVSLSRLCGDTRHEKGGEYDGDQHLQRTIA